MRRSGLKRLHQPGWAAGSLAEARGLLGVSPPGLALARAVPPGFAPVARAGPFFAAGAAVLPLAGGLGAFFFPEGGGTGFGKADSCKDYSTIILLTNQRLSGSLGFGVEEVSYGCKIGAKRPICTHRYASPR